MRLIAAALAWSAGIVAGAALGASFAFWLAMAVLGAMAAAATLSARTTGAARTTRSAAVLAALASLGAARYTVPQPPSPLLAFADRGGVTIEGVITRSAQADAGVLTVVIEAETLITGGEAVQVSGGVRVSALQWPELQGPELHGPETQGPELHGPEPLSRRDALLTIGSRVQATGLLSTPPQADAFDYRAWLARSGVVALLEQAVLEPLPASSDTRVHVLSPGLAVLAFAEAARDRAADAIDAALPHPTGALLRAMLLGDARALTPEVEAAFRLAGVSHLLVVSGFNLTLLGSVLLRGLRAARVPVGWAAAIALGGIVVYALIIGASAAVVRAAVMSGVLVVGESLRRRAFLPTSLAFALLALTLFEPRTLWDIGFQLSFAAAFGIALWADGVRDALVNALDRAGWNRALPRIMAESAAASLAAQAAVFPVLAAGFGSLSLIGIAANFVFVPAQPFILIIGAVGAAAGSVVSGAGTWALWAAGLPTAALWAAADAMARLPLTNVPIAITPWGAAALYGLAGGGTVLMMDRVKNRLARLYGPLAVCAGAAAVWLCVVAWGAWGAQPDGRLHVWFLGVGVGEHAVLVRTPGGAFVLVDGGAHPNRLVSLIEPLMPPNARGLAAAILTQANRAHVDALRSALPRLEPAAVFAPDIALAPPFWNALRAYAPERWHTLHDGQTLLFDDGAAFTARRVPAGDLPSDSAVSLVVGYGGASFLLTGGLSTAGQTALAPAVGPVVGLQAPVAGFGGGPIARALLTAALPQMVILPVASLRDQALGLDEGVWGERPRFRVPEGGLVHVATDGRTLDVTTHRPPGT
jgi:competence protein ComEC